MSLEKEINRLKQDPAGARALARSLQGLSEADWTDWEIDFLEGLARGSGTEPMSTRQLEKLIELRDASRHVSKIDGLSVPSLVHECWIARLDLSEDDEAFITSLKAQQARALKLRPLKRLLACSRQLGLIDHYVAV